MNSPGSSVLSPSENGEVPDLVPARMMNEFTYCPRLFYLEWVQSRFAESLDTEEGHFVHRVVDDGGGKLPDPDVADELKVARSVHVSSSSLGLIAVIDLLEGDEDGWVVPVDYKKGSPADNINQAHDPERIQVCVQGLLLRDNGYKCDHAVLYFATTKTRVRVNFDQELVDVTLKSVEELKKVASLEEAPPPLERDPRCPRCSLVGLCLPDETNLLAGRSRQKPRRLMANSSDALPLHVTEPGSYLGKDQGLLTVSVKGKRIAEVRLIDVSQLCVYGNVQVSSQLLGELMDRDVPIAHFTGGGWFKGITHGMPSKHVGLRLRQAALVSQGGIEIARRMIQGKIANCRVLLRRNAKETVDEAVARLGSAASTAERAETPSSLLGIEGAAARTYFEAFPSMLPPAGSAMGLGFAFNGRNRRPPTDPVNALLSFGYSMLTKDLTVATLLVGFDPYMGFYHRPRFGRPALALDLAEEFRPLIVDSVVVSSINNGEIQQRHFEQRGPAIALTKDGRHAFLRAYERRMTTEITHPMFGYRMTYRRILEVQARLLAAVMLGEIPTYRPFRTR